MAGFPGASLPHCVFVYGTLQFPDIARAVTGQERPAAEPATLYDYARYAVKRAPFPAIVPEAGGHVRGLVYTGVGPAALARIDAFEGEFYRRQTVTAVTDDGRRIEAYAYVVRLRYRARLTHGAWDEDAFAHRWHDAYVRACRTGCEPD